MSNLAIFNQTIQAPKTQAYLDNVLYEGKKDFVTSIVSLVGNNTMLQACEPLTIVYAAVKAAVLKLPIDPNLGYAYVIPYKNKGKDEAQFQLGAKGFVQLAMRSGQFLSINVREVKEGEILGEDFISGELQFKKLDEAKRVKTKTIGYVAYFSLLNGFKKSHYMSKEEVLAHAQRFSKAFAYGPWKTDFDAMAKKTVLKYLLTHYAPLSVEMQMAKEADQAIFRSESLTPEYDDNAQEPDTTQVDKVKEKAAAAAERARRAASAPKEEPEEQEQPEQVAQNEVPAPTQEYEPAEDVFEDMPEA